MPDGPQNERLLRLTPDGPDSVHSELIPRAPETPGDEQSPDQSITPPDPDPYGDERPAIDAYADTFNLRKVHPQPGFAPGFGPTPHEFAAFKETLFRLALTTPGAAGPVFTGWLSTLNRLWWAGHLGDPAVAAAHDFIRLIAHRPLGPAGRHDVRIKMALRNGVTAGDTQVQTYFFVPSPDTRLAFGTQVTSITYRVFVHNQDGDTFIERASPVFTASGLVRFEVREAVVLSGWRADGTPEPSGRMWIFAALTNGELRAAFSSNNGASWSDVGVVTSDVLFDGAIAVIAQETFWEFDFIAQFWAVYTNSSGDLRMFFGDIFDTTAAGISSPTTKVAGKLLAPAGMPGYITGKRGVWGRGATSSNDAANLSRNWAAFPFHDDVSFEYGVHIEGDPPTIPDTVITWGPDVELIHAVGAAVAAGRVFLAFYRPGAGTGEFRVVRVIDGQDDTAAGGIPWPFTVPAGETYVGSLAAIDNTLLMTYVRDIGGGTIEYGLAVGTVDQAAQPINDPADITWTFVPLDPGNLTGWTPQTISQLNGGEIGFEPFAELGVETQLSILRSGLASFWFETALKRLRVTAFPLASFPSGGSVVFDGDEVDRIGSVGDEDGRFIFTHDVRPVADGNEHVLVRAESMDSNGLPFHTKEIRAYLEPQVASAVNEPRSFIYSTMIENGSGDAESILTGGLLPASVSGVIGSGNFFEPTEPDPIENANYPADQDDYVIDLFEGRSADGSNERHRFYCPTWARTLRGHVYRAGGDWVTGLAGVRSLDITFQVNSARVIVENDVDGTQNAATMTIELALIDADTGVILHSFGFRDYALTAGGFGINGTDNTALGGSVSFVGTLPSSWQLAFLTYLSAGFNDISPPPNGAISRSILYRVDSLTLSIDPTGHVPLP